MVAVVAAVFFLRCSPNPKRHDGILIDAVHANEYSDKGLQIGNYSYHEINGYRFGFDYLRDQGVRCDYFREGRLDDKSLAGYRLLFINLVSAERPPFLVSEIQAIVKFVKTGGTLFVITDHSNCYFHAFRLEPLFTEFGIESPTDMICEYPPKTLASGNGWFYVDVFSEHPVTEGLRRIAVQTGGRVDSRYAVAWTSEDSWADAWENPLYGEGKSVGFYGNYEQDPDEPSGPFGVVLAKEFGRGRIIVVADQNMLSDTFINYADNYRLWLNGMSWGLHDKRLRDPVKYGQWKLPSILLVEPFDRPVFGSGDVHGMYNFWTLVSRYFWTFANDRLTFPVDLVVLSAGLYPLDAETVRGIADHLESGKRVVVLQTDAKILEFPGNAISQILHELKIDTPMVEKSEKNERRDVINLPGGGAISFFGAENVYNNSVLPEPTVAPSVLQESLADEVLEMLHEEIQLGMEAGNATE